ncbi:Hint domain-containing protein [Mesobacterium pallidum]|uniref:Hint domain-containing protein n=1 Tax=Mesobacterium pallidum TaxID=2872037 RepID=UPI001EE2A524|nr:Hint domain-containing protein [Mesobacterium pallidum]
MGTFTRQGGLVYNGTSGTVSYQNSFVEESTASDGDTDNTWESGDTDLFESGASYYGQITLTLTAGGTVVAPVIVTASLTVIELPLGTYPTDVDIPGTVDLGALSTEPMVVCFAAGTRIATPAGEVAVETLAIGDSVLTADGRNVPVKWIGRQAVDPRFVPAARLQLIRIANGALGRGLPQGDLVVTADHGMVLEGVICHAGALVNGTTITKAPVAETYTVYHVETEAHEIILANGAASETFIDNVARSAFDNYAEFVALYGDDPAPMVELPLPRAHVARQVPPALRARLAPVAAA